MADLGVGFTILGLGLVMLLWAYDRSNELKGRQPPKWLVYFWFVIGAIYLLFGFWAFFYL